MDVLGADDPATNNRRSLPNVGDPDRVARFISRSRQGEVLNVGSTAVRCCRGVCRQSACTLDLDETTAGLENKRLRHHSGQ